MELLLIRKWLTNKSTIGELFVDDVYECFTLEDVVRPMKIKGKTAISAGRYEVVITFSNRFKKLMPLLVAVPFFAGVRIHPGNTAENTEGCILVGRTRQADFIGESKIAYNALFPKLKRACAKGKVFIEIQDGKP